MKKFLLLLVFVLASVPAFSNIWDRTVYYSFPLQYWRYAYFNNSSSGYSSSGYNVADYCIKPFQFSSTGVLSFGASQLLYTSPAGTNYERFFEDFYFINQDVGWVYGYITDGSMNSIAVSNVLMKTTNGGLNWSENKTFTDYVGNTVLCDNGGKNIYFKNLDIGWVVTEGNKIYKTTDGGTTWNPTSITGSSIHSTNVTTNTITNKIELLHIVFSDCTINGGEIGYAVGAPGIILRTSDGGNSWCPVNTWKNPSQKYDDYTQTLVPNYIVSFRSSTPITQLFNNPNVAIYDIAFNSSNTVGIITLSDGQVLKSTDNGLNWYYKMNSNFPSIIDDIGNKLTTPTILLAGATRVSWQDDNNCFLFVNSGNSNNSSQCIRHSTDQGETWDEHSFTASSNYNADDKGTANLLRFYGSNNGWINNMHSYRRYNSTENANLSISTIDVSGASPVCNYNVSVANCTITANGVLYAEKNTSDDTYNKLHFDEDNISFSYSERHDEAPGSIHYNSSGTHQYSITGLTPNKTYVVRAYMIISGYGIVYSDIKEFTAPQVALPNVTLSCPTTYPTMIKEKEAYCGGNVSATGAALTLTKVGVCWSSVNTSPDITSTNCNKLLVASQYGDFNCTISNLNPNTKYYLRTFATNSIGTSYSAVCTFTTLPGVVTMLAGTASGTTSPTLGGSNIGKNSLGVVGTEAIIDKGIVYSTLSGQTFIGGTDAIANSNINPGLDANMYGGPDDYYYNLASLKPCITYYFRAYAVNSSGTSYGNEMSFNTDKGWWRCSSIQSLNAESFIDINRGWVVGSPTTQDFGILHTTDGGITWNWQATQASSSRVPLWDVQFINASTGWAIGGGGLIIQTTDGGTSWLPETTGTNEGLYGIKFIDAYNGWVVGSNGTILHTINGGTTWSPQISGTSNTLRSIDFANCSTATAIGDNAILFTTNGGATWTNKYTTTSNNWFGQKVRFINNGFGWIAGVNGRSYKTTNSGVTWTALTGTTQGCFISVAFVDNDNGWAGSGLSPGCISSSTDGGNTWQYDIQPGREFYNDLQFLNKYIGYSASDEGIFKYQAKAVPSVKTVAQPTPIPSSPCNPIFTGVITTDGCDNVTEEGFYYASSAASLAVESLAVASKYTISGSSVSSSFIQTINCSSTVYVRAYAVNSIGTGYGNIASFTCNHTMLQSTPQLTLQPTPNNNTQILSVKLQSAVIYDSYSNNSGLDISEVGAIYNTTPNVTDTNYLRKVVGIGAKEFNVFLDSLTPFTTYYLKTYAKNDSGTAYSSEINFTTLHTPVLPTVVTNPASLRMTSNDSLTFAFVGGNVTDSGYSEISSRGIIYTTADKVHVTDDNKIGSTNNGSAFGSFTGMLNYLNCNTSYLAKAYATNEVGTVYGNEITFTTLNRVVPATLNASFSAAIPPTTENVQINLANSGYSQNRLSFVCVYDTISGVTVDTNCGGTLLDTLTPQSLPYTYNSSISSLLPNTRYYIKALVDNEAGIGYSSEQSFITRANVKIDSVFNATSSSINVACNIPQQGNAGGILQKGVIYGTRRDSLYYTKIGQINNGSGFGSYVSQITGLSSYTKYYVQSFCTNNGGISFGNLDSVTTLPLFAINGLLSPYTPRYACGALDTISYSGLGCFIASDTILAELSNSLGSFTTPTIVGKAIAGNKILVSLPYSLSAGNNYLIRLRVNNTNTISYNTTASLNIKPIKDYLIDTLVSTCYGVSAQIGIKTINFEGANRYTYTWTNGALLDNSTIISPSYLTPVRNNKFTVSFVPVKSGEQTTSKDESVTILTRSFNISMPSTFTILPYATTSGNVQTLSSVSVSGTVVGTLAYTWYANSVSSANIISNITNCTFAVGANSYYLVATDATGCPSDALKFTVYRRAYKDADMTFGTNNNSFVQLYPTPCESEITINGYVGESKTAKIKLVDVLGNIIFTQNYNIDNGVIDTKINVENLANGSYLMILESEDDIVVSKLIKIR